MQDFVFQGGYCRFFCHSVCSVAGRMTGFLHKCLSMYSVLVVQKSVIIDHGLNMTLFLLSCVTAVVLRSANIAIKLQKIKGTDWTVILPVFFEFKLLHVLN